MVRGYLMAKGDNGIELFLIDPERILHLMNDAKVAGTIREMDENSRKTFGVDYREEPAAPNNNRVKPPGDRGLRELRSAIPK